MKVEMIANARRIYYWSPKQTDYDADAIVTDYPAPVALPTQDEGAMLEQTRKCTEMARGDREG